MKGEKRFFLISAMLIIAFFAFASIASAAVSNVRAILWQGDPGKYHSTIAAEDSGSSDIGDIWNTSSDNTLRVKKNNSYTYTAWVRAVIDWGSTTETVCIYDYAGGSCSEENLCTASYSSSTFDTSAATGAADVPVSIEYEVLDTCSSGDSYEFFLNGVRLGGAFADGDTCTCTPGIDVLIPDPDFATTSDDDTSTSLRGVINTTDTTSVWYKWVYGDGEESDIIELSGSTKYNIDKKHNYVGSVGTPFVAQLVVSNSSDLSSPVSDNYRVRIEEDNLNTRVNIAIDKGLWYLYKNNYNSSYLHTFNESPFMAWYQSGYGPFYASPTASAIQAFAINNHKINGNANDDPYVEAVQLGMNWLMQGYYSSSSYPMLRTRSTSVLYSGDNALGIEVCDYGRRPIYQGGQIMDAIIASGVLPSDDTGRDFSGRGTTWSYGELMQDMADMYSEGQYDGSSGSYGIIGGWRYEWGDFPDNSACQWAAIGMIPAQKAPWNVYVPDWVKSRNENWLAYSHYSWTSGALNYGGFGYTGSGYGWGTSPSGMVQMAFDGQIGYDDPSTGADDRDVKWQRTELYFAANWASFLSSNNTYGWYAFAKAMRLALPRAVERLVYNNLDWYNGSDDIQGLAERIVAVQQGDGSWSGNYSELPLTTAWMVITLRPAIFAAAPIACFEADPNPSYADRPITFDPYCSDHSDSAKNRDNIVSYEWDFDEDGIYDITTTDPEKVTHTFACASIPCTYPVTLRVTDDSDPALTATSTSDIKITNPPHPPVANVGGPYMVSLCDGDTLGLNGSGSYDPNDGEHEAGCMTCPDDTLTAWNWDITGAPFTYTDETGETITVDPSTYFSSGGLYNIGLKVVDNTSESFPASGSADLYDEDFGTVAVYEACICDLTARVKDKVVQIVWTDTEGGVYDIYRSTEGPNSGFELIANDHATTYATYLDLDVVNGTTYYYRVVPSGNEQNCGSNVATGTPTARVRRR